MPTLPYHTYCVTTRPGRSEAPPFCIAVIPPHRELPKHAIFVTRELDEAQRYIEDHIQGGGTNGPEKVAAGPDPR